MSEEEYDSADSPVPADQGGAQLLEREEGANQQDTDSTESSSSEEEGDSDNEGDSDKDKPPTYSPVASGESGPDDSGEFVKDTATLEATATSPQEGGDSEVLTEEHQGDATPEESGAAQNVEKSVVDEKEEESEDDVEMAMAVASASEQASKFLDKDSDSEEEKNEDDIDVSKEQETAEGEKELEDESREKSSHVESGMVVFGEDSDPEEGPSTQKRKRRISSDSDNHQESGGEEKEEEVTHAKKQKRGTDDESGSEEDEEEGVEPEASELQEEMAELGEHVEMGGGEGGEEEGEGGEGSDDDGVADERPEFSGLSDWDLMMQRRKDAMARARKRRRKDIDITANDDIIMDLIGKMRMSAEQDRQLNLARKPATKKLQLLPTLLSYLKMSDFQTALIECGILSALAEWLTPLPDHSLPHLKIRDSILDALKTFPVLDSSLLKSSKIGKAVMLLYKHPKETRKNREKAGKLVNEWARPIFGLASDFKSLSRDEREKRDYAHLTHAARRRLSSGEKERRPSQDEDYVPQKPGDKGWIGRARVPMPSTNDYVVRPKWNVEQEFKKTPSKKVLNRYEKHLQKQKQKKMQSKTTHAVALSIEGRQMPL